MFLYEDSSKLSDIEKPKQINRDNFLKDIHIVIELIRFKKCDFDM